MAVYTVGRRRVILGLLLTSALLLTLDLRGNPIIDTMRDVAARVIEPVEDALVVVTNPIQRAWNGIVNYDDVQRENEALRDQLDRLIGTQAAAEVSVLEYQELRALFNLPSLAGIETEVAQVVGESVNNVDQIVEIDKGRTSGIDVGMPVVNQAGLIGRVTSVTATTARVRLITDRDFAVNVKIVSGDAAVDEATPGTTPTGLTPEELAQAAADATSSTTTTTTSTTIPGSDPAPGTTLPSPSEIVPDTTLPGAPLFPTTGTSEPPVDDPFGLGTTTTDPFAQPATTTTTTPAPVEKEFGELEGRGPNRLPQVRFLQDNPALAVLEVGDLVFTAGGLASLAPADIPVGRVVNRADRPGSGGPLLDVEPHADLDKLNFVRVVLYKPLSEVEQ
jgi:rod shape-determining protein MreC